MDLGGGILFVFGANAKGYWFGAQFWNVLQGSKGTNWQPKGSKGTKGIPSDPQDRPRKVVSFLLLVQMKKDTSLGSGFGMLCGRPWVPIHPRGNPLDLPK